LFQDFANVWTPVAFAAELRTERPLAATVAGTRIVLFRTTDGTPHALLDRCPHRGAALSLGQVSNDCLECPFHGWRFDAEGRVVHVPWNPDAKLGHLRADVVPARETGGQIWIYTTVNAAPDGEPAVNEYFTAPGVRVSGTAVEWQAHWTRAMENMLDWPHLAFVHRASIGRELVKLRAGRMDVEREEHPWGVRSRITLDGAARPGMLDYRWPNQMNLHLTLLGRSVLLTVACVPIDSHRTRMLLSIVRPFFKSPLFDGLFNYSNRRIAKEDQAIVESSSPGDIADARDEKSVRTDALTLRFRKDYLTRLKGTAAAGSPARDGAACLGSR
jgi:phenylpropionate dioxygenase-like ring-hydroxylating dioxygenase large terminal subunit